MNPEPASMFERLAWIEAYLAHFDSEPESSVLEALGVGAEVLAECRAAWRVAKHDARTSGDFQLSHRFAAEHLRARVAIIQRGLTLEEVAHLVAARTRDETALPDVAFETAKGSLAS